MKKSTSLLLAGLTVLGLSGFTSCESNDPVADSVLLSELADGYKVTGTGTLGGSADDIASITFCNGNTDFDYGIYNSGGVFVVEGNILYFGEYDEDMNTADFETPGRLEVGVGYAVSNYLEDVWTVTGIEQVECVSDR